MQTFHDGAPPVVSGSLAQHPVGKYTSDAPAVLDLMWAKEDSEKPTELGENV